LQRQLSAAPPKLPNEVWRERLRRQLALFFQICHTWPARVAIAGLLLMLGFGAGRWTQLRPLSGTGAAEMTLTGPFTRVRAIQPVNDGRVRIVVDQVRPGELTGLVTDDRVRRLLLSATREASNPAIRVDSVEFLTGQTGADVQQALLSSLQQDSNAAVRMKALEALRPFAANPAERAALIGVMLHDEDPGLRSEAIDVLLSGVGRVGQTPDVLRAIQQAALPNEPDEYIRTRSIQFLRLVDGRAVEAY
jgi:hypothetical protein